MRRAEVIEKLEDEVRCLRASSAVTGRTLAAVPPQSTSDPPQEEGETLQVQAPIEYRAARVAAEEVPRPTLERTQQIHARQPPTDLVVSLTSLFFRHIHPWFPFLDVQRVCLELSWSENPTLLHYALFGLTLPYSFDSRLDQRSSDSFWKYTKRRIFLEVLEEPSFSALEALTILTLDLSGMTNGPQVWGALAIATTLLTQLDHKDSRVFRTSIADHGSSALNKVDSLSRETLFWAIYALDCYISITTSRPSCLTEDQLKSASLSRERLWQQTSWEVQAGMSFIPSLAWKHQLELLDFSRKAHALYLEWVSLDRRVDNIYRWLNQAGELSAELAEWALTILPSLQLSVQTDHKYTATARSLPSISLLHAYYHALVIHVHSMMSDPAYEALLGEPFANTKKDSEVRCLRSICLLSEIVSGDTEKDFDKLGWPFAWSVWVGARYLLALEAREMNPHSSKLATLLDALQSLSRYWQISGKYFRLLKQGIKEVHTGDCTNTPNKQGILPSLVDFRIATSDLEDLFRADPIVQFVSPGEAGELTADTHDYVAAAEAQQTQSNPADDSCSHFNFQAADNWFNVPLFASSAYQNDFHVPSQPC
ncbi:hypothetical protein N7539_008436 [Penicillium diatomitis]|uniref:Xylanolytic transcriptional activator regulatory domain-containing protein n=1 Tax=Penicillium diatomitis TaxID=2819901 RepID=A0A9W9WTT7_9EURO|nr:uncharacterized protein N7539_008436 [Penicillium diatomitis]KAJ5475370.1 hypothetical protein N7539_008436 [Penicillium diatomitis]